MSLQEVLRSVTSRADVVGVRNAFNPILWGRAVATPTCFLFAFLLRADPNSRYALVAHGALPVMTLTLAYPYFLLRDPDRLQSEELVLRQHEMAVLERKAALPVIFDAGAAVEAPDLTLPTERDRSS